MDEFLLINNFYCCSLCDKKSTTLSGIRNHIAIKHHNDIKRVQGAKGKKYKRGTTWNKGLTKETDERMNKVSNSLKNLYKNGILKKQGFAKWTDEQRKFWSEKQSKSNTCTRVKWYSVDNKKVQGKWELNIALKMNEFNINWTRCKPVIYYSNKFEKRYSPDFYLPNFDYYLEIKGVWWGDAKLKTKLCLQQNEFLSKRLKIIENKLYDDLIKSKNKEEFINIVKNANCEIVL